MSNLIAFPSSQEFQTMKELGEMAVRSGFLPVSINTPEKAIVIILKGREIGIPPMQAFSSIAVINGKPTMSAELMLALIYKNVAGAVINFMTTDESGCVIEAQRPGGKVTSFSFTMKDAERAQLTGKGPWRTYPAAMLRARCISAMARALFPDALSGIVYTPEEMGAETDDEGNVIEIALSSSTSPETAHVPASLQASNVAKKSESTPSASVRANPQPQAIEPGDFVIPFGKNWKGAKIRDCDPSQLEGFIQWCEQRSAEEKKNPSRDLVELRQMFDRYCRRAPTLQSTSQSEPPWNDDDWGPLR